MRSALKGGRETVEAQMLKNWIKQTKKPWTRVVSKHSLKKLWAQWQDLKKVPRWASAQRAPTSLSDNLQTTKRLWNDSWSIASICGLMVGPKHIWFVFLKPQSLESGYLPENFTYFHLKALVIAGGAKPWGKRGRGKHVSIKEENKRSPEGIILEALWFLSRCPDLLESDSGFEHMGLLLVTNNLTVVPGEV